MIIAPRWRKVLRDLVGNKTRTLLVVLSIAVGVAVIGVVMATNAIITRDLPASFAQVNPASATLITSAFDDDLVQTIEKIEGVNQAEGRYTLRLRLQTGPEQFRNLQVYVISDFNNIRINKLWPERGDWPPAAREMLVERSSINLAQAQVGDVVTVQTPLGQERQIKIAGLAHDLNNPSGAFSNQVVAYINFETLEWLGYGNAYNELLISVDPTASGDPVTDRKDIRKVASLVEERIVRSGRQVFSTTIPVPGQHWFEPFLATMAQVLTALSLMILVFSAFLVVNTVSAMLAQQVRQIGVMKAVGGGAGQILAMYLVFMGLIGLLALALALPLARYASVLLVTFLARIINFDLQQVVYPQNVMQLQAALSLGVPLLASLPPILRGARLTVREAISDYGLAQDSFGVGWFDRLVGALQGFSRPLMLSLRNTFRRKLRLLLTLATLALGSGVFIAVIGVNGALNNSLETLLNYYQFDLFVIFGRAYRVEQVMDEVGRIPGVDVAEVWGSSQVRVLNPDGSESNGMNLLAPPAETRLIQPQLQDGRWLLPGEEGALVINSDVLREAPWLKVGEMMTLVIDNEQEQFRLVGVVRSTFSGAALYTNYDYYARNYGNFGVANAIYIKILPDPVAGRGPLVQTQMAALLEQSFERAGLRVNSVAKVADLRRGAYQQFNIIFAFLLVMALLLTLVGGLGLAGTMSLNVLDRTREIGVMRAIGATNGAILQIILTEGVLIGVLSWALGLVVALPASRLLNDIIGRSFLRAPLAVFFPLRGALIVLAVTLVIASLASLLPARRATNLSVREVLAYE